MKPFKLPLGSYVDIKFLDYEYLNDSWTIETRDNVKFQWDYRSDCLVDNQPIRIGDCYRVWSNEHACLHYISAEFLGNITQDGSRNR